MAEKDFLELPDAEEPTFGPEGAGDDDEPGDLGQWGGPAGGDGGDDGGRRDPERRARDRLVQGLIPGIRVELGLDVLFPLPAWEARRSPEEQERLAGLSDGERWYAMIRGALARDMDADGQRPTAEQQYDLVGFFGATVGQMLERWSERMIHAQVQDRMARYRQALTARLHARFPDLDEDELAEMAQPAGSLA